MKDGQYPKCGAQTVYHKKLSRPGYGISSMQVKGAMNQAVPLDNYICAGCGYVELYMDNSEELSYITDHWDRVEGAGGGSDTRRLPSWPT